MFYVFVGFLLVVGILALVNVYRMGRYLVTGQKSRKSWFD